MAEDPGVWVYAVARSVPEDRLTGTTGVGGGRLRTVGNAGLVAAVSSVDLREYGEEPLRRHLEDLTWLEATARAHHAVVDAVAKAGPVVPVRLATVYRDDTRVAEMLAERRAELVAGLDRIEGRIEYGVKAYAEAGPVDRPGRPAEPGADETAGTSGAAVGPGTAYLLRRRADLSARDQALQAAVGSAEQVHSALGGLARAARRHAPQHPRLSGDAAPMVLNGAYLVDGDRAEEFEAAVRGLADRHGGVRLELTGPWPAYSFAGVEEEPR